MTTYVTGDWPECPCEKCNDWEERNQGLGRIYWARRFTMCPTCGNKRCPKGTDHLLTCTGSNEPGQAGSSYVNIR